MGDWKKMSVLSSGLRKEVNFRSTHKDCPNKGWMVGGRYMELKRRKDIWGKHCKHKRMYKYRHGVRKQDFTEGQSKGARDKFE